MQPSPAKSAHEAVAPPLPHQELQRAIDIQARHEQELFAHAGVIGVAVGRNGDTSTEPAFIIFLDRGANASSLPRNIEGVSVQIVRTGRLRHPSPVISSIHSCSVIHTSAVNLRVSCHFSF
jgi:hypothetical protein